MSNTAGVDGDKRITRITLSFPGDTPVPVPGGQWGTNGDRLIATFTYEEMVIALRLADLITGQAEENTECDPSS